MAKKPNKIDEETKNKLIEEWKLSGLTSNKFSIQKNIPKATFSSWVRKKYGTVTISGEKQQRRPYKKRDPKKNDISVKQNDLFAPISIVSPPNDHIIIKNQSHIFNEIIIDNRIILRLNSLTPPQVVVEIIKGLTK